jgi:hypothetical protein
MENVLEVVMKPWHWKVVVTIRNHVWCYFLSIDLNNFLAPYICRYSSKFLCTFIYIVDNRSRSKGMVLHILPSLFYWLLYQNNIWNLISFQLIASFGPYWLAMSMHAVSLCHPICQKSAKTVGKLLTLC